MAKWIQTLAQYISLLVKQLFNSFQSSEALRWPYSPPEVHLWEHRSYSKNLPSRDSFSTAVPSLVRNKFKSKRGHLNGLFSFLKSGLEALGVGQLDSLQTGTTEGLSRHWVWTPLQMLGLAQVLRDAFPSQEGLWAWPHLFSRLQAVMLCQHHLTSDR